jgi:hypothetical protein
MMKRRKKGACRRLDFHKIGLNSLLLMKMVWDGQTSSIQPICVFLRFELKS